MKKQISLYISILTLCFIVIIALNSCKKSELVSRELLLYVKGDYASTTNTMTFSLTRTPLAIWGGANAEIPIYATHEVPANIDAYIYPDDRFISQYNQSNGTNYILLPSNTYKLNSDKHRINANSLASDPLTFELTNPAALTDTKGYILPLTVTKYESEDKGPVISTNKGTVYLVFPYIFTNIDTVQTPLTDPTMSRTGWSVTVSNTTSGALGPAMLDGSNTTAWRSSNSTSAAKWVILDMGSTQTIKGFKIVPNYVSTSENATQMYISTSADNVTFTAQGVWNGTGPASGSSATSPDIKGVNFFVPVQARYFRFDITALVSGGRVGIGELNAVQ